MRNMLYRARKNGWPFGAAKDDRSRGVLYIDTPLGQVSFHLQPGENGYPAYAGKWSGVRNSDQIIARILSEEKVGR